MREVGVGGHNKKKETRRDILGIPADRHVPVYMIITLIMLLMIVKKREKFIISNYRSCDASCLQVTMNKLQIINRFYSYNTVGGQAL